jgi:hypothetical protein
MTGPSGGSPPLTLQINVAAVDVPYAKYNVPHLARAHRAAAREIILTIDRCKPQKTKQTDPAVRCKEPEFSRQLDELEALGASLIADRLVDRVLVLRSDDPWLAGVTRKYSGPWLPETHDYGGRPITGYWAGIEAATTRYVIHYDGDMFLHQEPGFDWAVHAIPLMNRQEKAITATPRLTAPYASRIPYGDYGSAHEVMAMLPVEGGWKQHFFSTRAFVVDREKLDRHLPLARGRMLVEQLAVKMLRRGFPRSAEKMMWFTTGREGGYRLILSSEDAWLLHPIWKPDDYAAWVPAIIECVEQNRVPHDQLGKTELQLKVWQQFLSTMAHTTDVGLPPRPSQ